MITIRGGPDPRNILVTDENGTKINDIASIEIPKIEPGMVVTAKLEIYANINLCANEEIVPIYLEKKFRFDRYFKYLAKGFLNL